MIDVYVIGFLFIFGICIGSFLNVLIYRIPRRLSIVWPPSSCPSCQWRLLVSDLIPIFSYLWLRGKCRYCREPISISYLVVELVAGIFTVVWALCFNIQATEVWRLILGYFLIVIATIDLKTHLIPNRLTYPLMLSGLVYQWIQGEMRAALLGGLVGGGLLLVVYLLHPRGMGMGDVKLLTLLGILLGVRGVLRVLFWGSLSGVVLLFPLVWKGRIGRQQPVPFAPFLAFGTYVVLLFH